MEARPTYLVGLPLLAAEDSDDQLALRLASPARRRLRRALTRS